MSIKMLGIKNFLSGRSGSRFRQNFIKVAQANIFAQALPLMAMPVLTRLFSPSDFSILGVFNATLSIIASIATLKLEWSVPNASTRQQAAALILGGLAVLFLMSALLTVLLSLDIAWEEYWTGIELVAPYLYWLPVALLGTGGTQLLQAWHVREADLSPVSTSRIRQSIAKTLSQLGFGFIGTGALGLILSAQINAWVGIGLLWRKARGLTTLMLKCTLRRVLLTFKKFLGESIHSTGVALVNNASLSILPLLLILYYKPTEVGWYVLMHRLAVAPISSFTSALAQSFWSEAAVQIKSDPQYLRELYIRTTKKISLFAILPVLICISGPLYVDLILGEQWQGAGWILCALAPMILGQVVVSPLSHLVVHRKQHWQFGLDIIRLLAIATVCLLAAHNGFPFVMTISAVSIVHFIFYGIVMIMNLLAYRQYENQSNP
jgi:O-antigen/teichoic acid export membrane protein